MTNDQAAPGSLRYVLITASRNEAAHLISLIKAVKSQSVPPFRWVIASDGSTDGSDRIIEALGAECDWVQLLRMPARCKRSYAGKARAFNAAYELLKGLSFDFVANIDADITFGADHFAFLLSKFREDPQLGLAGTGFRGGWFRPYDYRIVGLDHVSGPCQMFRRECLEQIGGYTPSDYGGIDVIAVIKARMAGWKTQTFTDHEFEHHRQISSAGRNALSTWFSLGRKDYVLGAHPLWEFLRSFYHLSNPPFLLGGVSLLAGYAFSAALCTPRPVSSDFVKFYRSHQMQRLGRFLSRQTVTEQSKAHRRHTAPKSVGGVILP